jgi:Spherulation-specific family 4
MLFMWGLGLLTALAVSPAAVSAELEAGKSSSPVGIAVPAYFAPSSRSWRVLEANVSSAGPQPAGWLLVVNPDSGPGPSRSAAYAAGIAALREKQRRARQASSAAARVSPEPSGVVGYVYTEYGKRPAELVERDIALYAKWYGDDALGAGRGLNGIFFDQGATTCTAAPYYARLVSFAKRALQPKNGSVATVLNCGAPPTSNCLMETASVVITFEGSFDAYRTFQNPSWVLDYPRTRFWHIVHTTPLASSKDVVNFARERHAGYVYGTYLTEPNPYNSLPLQANFWNVEVAAAAG